MNSIAATSCSGGARTKSFCEPDLDLIPKVEESASNQAVCTWKDVAQQPTRRAWTLMQRRCYEAANVPFAIEATADIMPRFAAYHVTHLRVYFDLRLAAGTYHLRQRGLYMGRQRAWQMARLRY